MIARIEHSVLKIEERKRTERIFCPGNFMQENITQIKIDEKEITLIGTAHVSLRSADEVKEMIETLQPDTVCIELDKERYSSLKNPKKWEDSDIIQVIKQKKVAALLVNIILSSYQKRMAEKMDSSAGQEMKTAIRCAEKSGAHLELIDRNIQTTFSRIWRKHSFWQKCRLIASIIGSIFDDEEITEEDIENLKQSELLESALKEVRKEFPVVAEVLIHERDQCLAYNIKHASGKKIVAVVGAAHVPGILKEIHQDIDINELCSVPEKSLFSRLCGWLIPLLILALIGYGFTQSSQTGFQQILSWVLWNGSLSAIGTLIAGAHPLSILTAFVAAPITSLNPLLAAGWFAGLCEATLRKPKVRDFEQLSSDVSTFRGFFKNRVTHILLVVILANLFSTVGTLIGGWDVLRTLF